MPPTFWIDKKRTSSGEEERTGKSSNLLEKAASSQNQSADVAASPFSSPNVESDGYGGDTSFDDAAGGTHDSAGGKYVSERVKTK
jgi:hypothetical protein